MNKNKNEKTKKTKNLFSPKKGKKKIIIINYY